jgi:YD repeat-containing protein
LVYSAATELTTAYGFDADGNQLTVTDPLGNVTTYQYDHLNRPVEEIDPSPDGVQADPTTSYLNRETQVAQRASNAPGHDAVDSKLVNFTYNADGQTASIDRFAGASSVEVAKSSYGYDDLGRLTSLTHTAADGTTTYAAYTWRGRNGDAAS